jgi:hypothetical protein
MIKGITTDTRTQSIVEFPVSKEQWKHPAVLKDVQFGKAPKRQAKLLDGVTLGPGEDPTVDQVRPEDINISLKFVLTSPDDFYTHIETMYAPKPGSKSDTRVEIMNGQIAHLFEAFAGQGSAPKYLSTDSIAKVLDVEAIETYEQYFKGIAAVFNTAKEGGPVYKEGDKFITGFIKLVRRGRTNSPNVLQFPTGNFFEILRDPAQKSILQQRAKDVFDMIQETPKAEGPTNDPLATPNLGTAGNTDWPA